MSRVTKTGIPNNWMSGHSSILLWMPKQNFFGARLKPYPDIKQCRMNLGVTSNLSTAIYTYIHSYQGDQYWLTKPDVNEALLKEVDWKATKAALKSIPRQQRVFLTKHVCGMCGLGKFLKRWKEWQHDSCLRCGTREDASHIWLYNGQDTNLLWEKALIGLHEWMMKADTDPNIAHLIIETLTEWRNGNSISGNSTILQDLFERQELIGWQRFFEGWLTQEWARVQQSYYDLIHSRKRGRH